MIGWLTLLSCLIACGAQARQHPIEWLKVYGGAMADEAHCIRLTADGGYIVATGPAIFRRQLCRLRQLHLPGTG